MKAGQIIVLLALFSIVLVCGCLGSKANTDNNTQVNTTPDIQENKTEDFVYKGTLTFSVDERYVPSYKEQGFGIIDDLQTDYSINGTVLFSNLTLIPEWKSGQDDYKYGNGYFTENFVYAGSVFSKYSGYDTKDTFSGSFDDFAIIGEYVPKGTSGDRGIKISLLHPNVKTFNTPLAEFIEPKGSGSGPEMLTQQVTGEVCYVNKQPVNALKGHIFDVSGGSYDFSCSYEDLQTPRTYHTWNATLTLARVR